MKYRWALRPISDPEAVRRLQRELNDLPEALARALVLRGITSFDQAKQFFRPQIDHLHDPFLMQDMAAAADRVARAIREKEQVLVYGDYDVDGTTSTALMTTFLAEQGAAVSFFIPDRIEHGYGLHTAGIDAAVARGATLIVALDCGITGHEEAEYAKQQGLDLVICDHHTPGETIPYAVAVLDPKRADCAYPFKELCGCGVGFKLIQATLQRLGKTPETAYTYLDLVAIATASDIVPIYGENRVLMREGFRVLDDEPRLGVRQLAAQSRANGQPWTTSKIVFNIGPRINAAGRLGDAGRAVALLTTQEPSVAAKLAYELEQANDDRRDIDQATQTEAITMAERQLAAQDRRSIVLHNPDWHPGVIGIVASRLVERFYRPTILLTSINGVAKGSARSITGVNVYDALHACADLLQQFGGHDYAAGMALDEANVPAFQRRFDEVVQAVIQPEMLFPTLDLDAAVNLADLDSRFWAVLKQFAPFGPHNMTPVFRADGLEVVGEPRTMGKHDEHLKFRVCTIGAPRETTREVVGFRMREHLSLLRTSQREGQPLRLAFSIEENTWRGRTTLQLRARDIQLDQPD